MTKMIRKEMKETMKLASPANFGSAVIFLVRRWIYQLLQDLLRRLLLLVIDRVRRYLLPQIAERDLGPFSTLAATRFASPDADRRTRRSKRRTSCSKASIM